MDNIELCCEHAKEVDCVKWNPFNKVVQCHSCGHVYLPVTKEVWNEKIGKSEEYGQVEIIESR